MKAGIIYILFALLFGLLTSTAFADEATSGSSATFAGLLQQQQKDDRVVVLRKFLENQNSPLAPLAEVFVAQADLYKLPWDLVAAMTGTESSFGQAVPIGCNNPLGFGIYTGHMTCFPTYQDAIEAVSKSIRNDYMDKWHANDVYSIGHIYAASETWGPHTDYFMNQIEEFKLKFDSQTLPISL